MPVSPQAVPSETFLYQRVFPQADALRFGFLYPASYAVSMASLGYLLLFALVDQLPAIAAKRLTTDALSGYRAQDFDVIGISFSFELDIHEIFRGLDGLGLPLVAQERDNHCPLVFAGGPVPTTNPEPYAAFFDFFLIGDGEEVLPAVLQELQRFSSTITRAEKLRYLAQHHPGVYVPSLYAVTYFENLGPIRSITPLADNIPYPVRRATVSNMDANVAATPILSSASVYGDSYLVEVRRGCAHRCRFCLASYSTLPVRSASLEAIWRKIEAGLAHTSHIGLLGALIADHPDFSELCQRLTDVMDRGTALRLSCSSLRADTLTPIMVETFRRAQQNQLTIAIESGSPRVRVAIHKHLSQDAIFNAAELVVKSGMKSLKLYTMVGLPTETEDDISETVMLAKALKGKYPQLKLTLGCSSFVPKAATPFQWQARLDNVSLEKRLQFKEKHLRNVAQFRPNSVKWDSIQAMLSRGDRRLSPLLIAVYRLGGSLGHYNRAFKQFDDQIPSMAWYAFRERPEAEIFPWDHIHLGVPKTTLWEEAQLSLSRGHR